MRKIEQEMRKSIIKRVDFKSGNTEVRSCPNGSEVYLHGNHIAGAYRNYYGSIVIEPNVETLLAYPTRTTMSRLRALGVDVYQRRGKVYLNGVEA